MASWIRKGFIDPVIYAAYKQDAKYLSMSCMSAFSIEVMLRNSSQNVFYFYISC